MRITSGSTTTTTIRTKAVNIKEQQKQNEAQGHLASDAAKRH